MIYKVTFGIGKPSASNTRSIQPGGNRDRTILVPSATSRGDALRQAVTQVADEDVYSAKVDPMDAEILVV